MIVLLQMPKIQLLREGRGNNVQKNKSVFHTKNAMIGSFFTTKWLLCAMLRAIFQQLPQKRPKSMFLLKKRLNKFKNLNKDYLK